MRVNKEIDVQRIEHTSASHTPSGPPRYIAVKFIRGIKESRVENSGNDYGESVWTVLDNPVDGRVSTTQVIGGQ